jgi:hypothetical protein
VFSPGLWLDKTSDFPDAVRQFGVHALALVFNYISLEVNTVEVLRLKVDDCSNGYGAKSNIRMDRSTSFIHMTRAGLAQAFTMYICVNRIYYEG